MVDRWARPFITLCDYDAPLRLYRAGFKTTYPRGLAVWSLWHPLGLGDVDFDLTQTSSVVRARIVSDELATVVAIVEGTRTTCIQTPSR